MAESRWLRWIGTGIVALGAVGVIAATTLGAGDRPWAPPACSRPPGDVIAAVRAPRPVTPAGLPGEVSFRVGPLLDRAGALSGQRLAVGVGDARVTRSWELPRESFADGPWGGEILVGTDDGTVSRIYALDAAAGCARTLATERDVIRRATVDPLGAAIIETRVDRVSRADLGVWRRALDGGPARRLLEPLAADARFGRTFSTELAWDVKGDRLAIQSCGEVACRTRIVARDGRLAAELALTDLGPLVGIDGDRLVSYGACRGLPCPIISTDLVTGARRILVADGGPAIVVASPDGAQLVSEAPSATGRVLRSVALDGVQPTELGPIPDGLALRLDVARSAAATRIPQGWVLLAGDPAAVDRPSARSQLRRIPDGATVPFDEVIR